MLWSFERLVKRIAARHGKVVAGKWMKVVVDHLQTINMPALHKALVHADVQEIERVLQVGRLQKSLEQALVPEFVTIARATGLAVAEVLQRKRVAYGFQVGQPNLVLNAREQAAELVRDIPNATRNAIGDVLLRGQAGKLTVAQQANAISKVVGLPKNWAEAPQRLAEEIVEGKVAAATGRRLSAVEKRRIKNSVAAGTNTGAFAQEMADKYAKNLILSRSKTIARTETQRAAHIGLVESWTQADRQGALPKTMRRFWIVAKDEKTCLICLRIPGMNRSGRRLNEPFMTPEGLVMHPPAPHPNCRCTEGLGVVPP